MNVSSHSDGSPVAPWLLSSAVGIVLLNIAAGIAAASVAGSAEVGEIPGVAGTVARSGLLVAPYLLALGLAVLTARAHRWSWTDAVGLRAFEPGRGIALALGVAFAGRLLATAWRVLVFLAGFEPPAELDVTRLFPVDAVGVAALFAIAVIVGPFVEEVVFRGVLYGALRNRVGPGWGMWLSGTMFGLVHVDLLWLVVPTALLGVALAWLMEKTGSLWVSVVAHMAFNLAALVLAYSARSVGLV